MNSSLKGEKRRNNVYGAFFQWPHTPATQQRLNNMALTWQIQLRSIGNSHPAATRSTATSHDAVRPVCNRHSRARATFDFGTGAASTRASQRLLLVGGVTARSSIRHQREVRPSPAPQRKAMGAEAKKSEKKLLNYSGISVTW